MLLGLLELLCLRCAANRIDSRRDFGIASTQRLEEVLSERRDLRNGHHALHGVHAGDNLRSEQRGLCRSVRTREACEQREHVRERSVAHRFCELIGGLVLGEVLLQVFDEGLSYPTLQDHSFQPLPICMYTESKRKRKNIISDICNNKQNKIEIKGYHF